MRPITIRRYTEDEGKQAIEELEGRGFEVIFPLTEFTRDGKTFDRDSFNRRIFVENTFHSVWIAKLRKVESE